jgi:hypothetical protein
MQRPTPVTVFGILNIVLGAMRLLTAPIVVLALVSREYWLEHLPQNDPVTMPFIRIMTDPNFITVTYFTTGLNIVASGGLLAAGIGLLKVRPWARYVSIGWGVYSCFATTVGTVLSYQLVYGPALDREGSGRVALSMTSSLLGNSIWLFYPAAVVIFMFLPGVKTAFEPGWGEPPPTPAPDEK